MTISGLNQTPKTRFTTGSTGDQNRKQPALNPKKPVKAAQQQKNKKAKSTSQFRQLGRQLSVQNGLAVNLKKPPLNSMSLCKKIVKFVINHFLKGIKEDEKKELKDKENESKKITKKHSECLKKQSQSLANGGKWTLAAAVTPIAVTMLGHGAVNLIDSNWNNAITNHFTNLMTGNGVVGMGNAHAIDQALESKKRIADSIGTLSNGLGQGASTYLDDDKKSRDFKTQSETIPLSQESQNLSTKIANKYEEYLKHTKVAEDTARGSFKEWLNQASKIHGI